MLLTDPQMRTLVGLIISLISVIVIYGVIKKLKKMKDESNK